MIASISAIDIPTLPPDHEPDDDEVPDEDDKTLDWTIEVADSNGVVASLPLSFDVPLYPLIDGVTRRAHFLQSEERTEVLFRRFEFPLDAFGDVNGNEIDRITFRFDRSKRGAIIIDDLSLIPSREFADGLSRICFRSTGTRFHSRPLIHK